MISGEVGVQILFRKLPLGFTIGYIPKPLFDKQLLVNDQFLGRNRFCWPSASCYFP